MRKLAILCVLVPSLARGGDRADCRRARRSMTVESWTGYVLEYPFGRCQDEAVGNLLVLSVGRIAGQLAGDPSRLALSLAQLSQTPPEQLKQLAGLLGGDLSGWGGPSGSGALSVLGTLDGLTTYDGDSYGIGGLGGAPDADPNEVYVSYFVDEAEGSFDEDVFWAALDATRPTLQACWLSLGHPPMSVYYAATFRLAAGEVVVERVERTYSDNDVQVPEVDACVRESLEGAVFPAEHGGTYTYRVELY